MTRWKRILGGVLGSIAISFCAAGSGSPAAAAELRKVRVAVPNGALSVSTAPYTSLPQALGYWKQEGLDVDVIATAGSAVALQMLNSGQADYALTGLPNYLAMRGQTKDVTTYYCVYAKNQFRIAVLPDSPIHTLQDLAGKNIGVMDLASASVPYTRAVLQRVGVDPSSVRMLALTSSPASMANALSRKIVDGTSSFDSVVGGVDAILNTRMRNIETPYDQKLKCGLVIAARPDVVKSQREAAIGVARGIAKGTSFAVVNPEAAVELHWRTYPETRPSASVANPVKAATSELLGRLATMEVSRDKNEIWGSVSPEDFQFYEDFLAQSGEIKRTFPFAEAFDTSLIRDINIWDEAALRASAKTYKPD